MFSVPAVPEFVPVLGVIEEAVPADTVDGLDVTAAGAVTALA